VEARFFLFFKGLPQKRPALGNLPSRFPQPRSNPLLFSRRERGLRKSKKVGFLSVLGSSVPTNKLFFFVTFPSTPLRAERRPSSFEAGKGFLIPRLPAWAFLAFGARFSRRAPPNCFAQSSGRCPHQNPKRVFLTWARRRPNGRWSWKGPTDFWKTTWGNSDFFRERTQAKTGLRPGGAAFARLPPFRIPETSSYVRAKWAKGFANAPPRISAHRAMGRV